ncbi:MAG: DUF4434 domain-containing protein [Promethearchaeota archaeon]
MDADEFPKQRSDEGGVRGLGLRVVLVPPSPVSSVVPVEVRGSAWNKQGAEVECEVEAFIDHEDPENQIYRGEVVVPAGAVGAFNFWLELGDFTGEHSLLVRIKPVSRLGSPAGSPLARVKLEIVETGVRSTRRLGGAWVGFYHWSEREGAPWNGTLAGFEAGDWREVVRGVAELGMRVLVVQEVFRNQEYHGEHRIERRGYRGRAFYPSRLYPGRMPLPCADPVEVVMAEADQLDLRVFLGVGLYAWFDYTPGALDWAKRVVSELWASYGHHPSLYGWYISSEVHGNLAPVSRPRRSHGGLFAPRVRREGWTRQYRQELVTFFREFRKHCDQFAPHMPVMLASNCHHLHGTGDVYGELLEYLDILCPFGFHRMPKGDLSGEEAALWLQDLCDGAKAHLWLDLEVFNIGKGGALVPRDVEGLFDDIDRFPNFEKILCYQYPGLLTSPWARKRPGGEDPVKLYTAYKERLEGRLSPSP